MSVRILPHPTRFRNSGDLRCPRPDCPGWLAFSSSRRRLDCSDCALCLTLTGPEASDLALALVGISTLSIAAFILSIFTRQEPPPDGGEALPVPFPAACDEREAA